ncbi:MAG TPA: signal peptidase I [Candidatus Saccharimonadales bacterium]|nr:signal peptidase I [Candidatus Saccharimonadales bacterium]
MEPTYTPGQPSAAPQPQTSVTPAPAPQKEGWRNVISTIAVLVIAPIIAILLTAFVFQSYEVSGPSMETTLSNNDRLIVWKLPRTWAKITHHAYVPKRGDIIIFDQSGLPDGEKQLIKRVVGLPGDRVVIHDGVLTVYNHEHPGGFQPDKTLSYGKVIGDTEPENDQQEWVIGKNQLFVCGDNRSNSLDSRTFNQISTDQVIGKLVMRVAPFSQMQRF